MTVKDQRDLEVVLPRILKELDGLNSVDEQRTLGLLFYERLTGQSPTITADGNVEFDFSNHLYIPLAVSLIIQKMTYQNQSDRYQSLQGVQDDLSRCLHELQSSNKISKFFPGKSDKPSDLHFSNFLYGRDSELEQLSDIVTKAKVSLLMVSGYSGVGKTSLIEEAIRQSKPASSFFIRGKFDQTLNQPYAAFVTAISGLVSQIQALGPIEQSKWKQSLNEALQPNAQVLINVLPDLEQLLGPQPNLLELDTEQSKNRFNSICLQFFHALLEQNKDLILFLDDLQWVDAASLDLIKLLIEQLKQRFLLVGAYRDNECDEQHQLTHFMKGLRPQALKQIKLASLSQEQSKNQIAELLYEIPLEGLSPNDVQMQIQDIFKANATEAAPLADLIHSKTHGNPFFTKQLIGSLKSRHLITFDESLKRWTWNLATIKEQEVSENVGDFMAKQFHIVPEETKELLLYAACLGHTFNLRDLSDVLLKDELQLELSLWVAVNRGLVSDIQTDEGKRQYKFLHDRIQQTAYQSRPEEDVKHCHLAIAKALELKRKTLTNSEFLKMVDHYNTAITILRSADLPHLFDLNIDAIAVSKQSVAFAKAYTYVKQALGLSMRVSTTVAKQNKLQAELAHCSYLTGRHEQAEKNYLELINKDLSVADKIDCYCKLSLLYMHTGRPALAVPFLRPAFRLIGVNMPKKVRRVHNIYLYLKFKYLFWKIPKMAKEQPTKEDLERSDSITKIHSYFSSPTYMGDQQVHVYQKLTAVIEGMLVRGDSVYTAIISHVLRHSNKMNEAKIIYERCKQTKELREDPNSKDFFGRGGFITPYFKHISEALLDLEASTKRARNNGELMFESYSVALEIMYSYLAGENLSTFVKNTEHKFSLLEKSNVFTLLITVKALTYAPKKLIDASAIEDEAIQEIEKSLDVGDLKVGLFIFYLTLIQYYVIVKDIKKAKEYCDKLGRLPNGGLGMLQGEEFMFLRALVAYIEAQDKSWPNKIKALYIHSKDLRVIKHLATLNPANFKHSYCLLKAERFRLLGKPVNAKQAYEEAINAASKNGFIHYAAIAAERAGKIKEALSYYDQWGAKAKVDALKS